MYSGILFLAGTIIFSATVESGGALAKLPPKGFFPCGRAFHKCDLYCVVLVLLYLAFVQAPKDAQSPVMSHVISRIIQIYRKVKLRRYA
jgi:hypothetical protein